MNNSRSNFSDYNSIHKYLFCLLQYDIWYRDWCFIISTFLTQILQTALIISAKRKFPNIIIISKVIGNIQKTAETLERLDPVRAALDSGYRLELESEVGGYWEESDMDGGGSLENVGREKKGTGH
ncbi:hypothetical protein K435DRAFT_798369 [Dendrothele bispora CBS 962.96]|uniref:Uncharacterized protein n=1 Tax=Dendrothele bispora (strain CBS 962.96) TaxID=1314807 RepID=A0A4S8LZG5_DENBC|nr:hypothetical protein K435DRAFT_798369 [Dendrothele bispora CBS 962.96]